MMLSCCRLVHHVHHVYSELCSMLSCCKHFQYVKYVQCYHVAGMFIQAGMVSPLLAKMFSKDISITSSVAGRRYHKFETLMLISPNTNVSKVSDAYRGSTHGVQATSARREGSRNFKALSVRIKYNFMIYNQ